MDQSNPSLIKTEVGWYTDMRDPCTVVNTDIVVNMACSKENVTPVVSGNILAFDFEMFYRFLEDEAVTDEDVEKLCDEVNTSINMTKLSMKQYYLCIDTYNKIFHFHVSFPEITLDCSSNGPCLGGQLPSLIQKMITGRIC